MTRKPIPGWFVVPAQPVRCDRPPAGRGWVHEIKHDGYRVLVRRDGAVVRIYSRNAINWTDRFSTIAAVVGVLASQCLDRRIADQKILAHQVDAWQDYRNRHHAKANWQFTTADARVKLKRLYPQFE